MIMGEPHRHSEFQKLRYNIEDAATQLHVAALRSPDCSLTETETALLASARENLYYLLGDLRGSRPDAQLPQRESSSEAQADLGA